MRPQHFVDKRSKALSSNWHCEGILQNCPHVGQDAANQFQVKAATIATRLFRQRVQVCIGEWHPVSNRGNRFLEWHTRDLRSILWVIVG